MQLSKSLRYALIFIAGVYLLSKPQCRHGCRTVAEHLLSYGFKLVG